MMKLAVTFTPASRVNQHTGVPTMASSHENLSRRERQIMDVLYRNGQSTAAQVLDSLPDAPSYSAVRALLRILEEKGHVRHKKAGARYVYSPTVSAEKAKASALKHMVATFFQGSVSQTMAALLDMKEDLSPDDLARLEELIEQARNDES